MTALSFYQKYTNQILTYILQLIHGILPEPRGIPDLSDHKENLFSGLYFKNVISWGILLGICVHLIKLKVAYKILHTVII